MRRKYIILSAAKQTLMSSGKLVVLAAAVWVFAGVLGVAQSGQSSSGESQKPTSDNPFPGEAPQAPAPQPDAGKPAAGSQDQAAPKKSSDNPFPGEDSNAPIIPTEPGTGTSGSGASGTGRSAGSGTPGHRDSEGDPVRSPDGQGHYAGDAGSDDGFSSSLSGVNDVPAPDAGKARPPVPVENVQEDLNVGKFYLQSKNWRAAQSRFSSAFAADKENPDAVWGLAEAERHLGMLKEADTHYKLLLVYDPGGPHGKEARKALEEVEAKLNSPGLSKK
ncbi:tetratricopeptide repeat protein [Acidicapsa dinghuensis]|uniref:Tetratricopeptide repeat protein n=2 Tax=Acidicapsa dinghuensis TaxID=2218256 RepID=A0ABW1ENY5_9BACT|nr:tetratricopeptide repeat protein [Acidicapsa dinghuensis]